MKLEITMRLSEHTLGEMPDVFDEKRYVIETPGCVLDHEDEIKMVEAAQAVVDLPYVIGQMCQNLQKPVDECRRIEAEREAEAELRKGAVDVDESNDAPAGDGDAVNIGGAPKDDGEMEDLDSPVVMEDRK